MAGGPSNEDFVLFIALIGGAAALAWMLWSLAEWWERYKRRRRGW